MSESQTQAQHIGRDEFVTLLMRQDVQLRGFVATVLGRFTEVDEVVQNTSLTAWKKLDSFTYQQPTPDVEFHRWLCTIARYELLSLRRKRGASTIVFNDELISQLADSRLEQAEHYDARHRALVSCLERLNSRDRELLSKRYGDGVRARDIAASLGRSLEGLRKSLARVRRSLLYCIDRTLRQEGSN